MERQSQIMTVGNGRRIRLPDFLGIEEGQQVIIKKEANGEITLSNYSTAPKKVVYGVVIGREFVNSLNADLSSKKFERWWGIFIDENGIVLGRQRSSSREMLWKDLSCPDSKGREKLNNQCGKGMWNFPLLIDLSEIPSLPHKSRTMVQTIQGHFREGQWPPIR